MSTPVDLKEQFEKNQQKSRGRAAAALGLSKKKPTATPTPLPDALAEMYQEKDAGNIRKIDRPEPAPVKTVMAGSSSRAYQLVIVFLLAFLAYQYFFNIPAPAPDIEPEFSAGWYKISLENGEYFYGQINRFSDPLKVTSVYYDYDRRSGQASPDSNIRLIKAQEDLSGTDGSVIVPFAGAKYEQLSPESKVLKAILEYERL